MRCALCKWILVLFIFEFAAAFRALNSLLHPFRISLPSSASTLNGHQVFVTLKKVIPRSSLPLRCKADDSRAAPAEDPFFDVDESVLRLQTERDKVLAELDLERAMNVHGEIGAREKVLLCALDTLEESVGSVYGLESPQSERVQALKSVVLQSNENWSLLKMSEPVLEGGGNGGDLRSSKEKLMAELDCDCQLSRDGVVGARERVLMSALSALAEGVGELYGPNSTVLERLREVQEEVLEGRQWSLLQVSDPGPSSEDSEEEDYEAVGSALRGDGAGEAGQPKSMWQLALERERILQELNSALPSVGGEVSAREEALRAALARVEAAICSEQGL